MSDKVTLTPNQRRCFEHNVKIGMIDELHRKGLLSDLLYMEAVRIQKEKDRQDRANGAD